MASSIYTVSVPDDNHSSNPNMTKKLTWTTALIISVCVVDSVTIAYDGSLMGSLNVMPSYNTYFRLSSNPTLLAVNTCATFIGAILIGPLAGLLIDSSFPLPWGRGRGGGRLSGLWAAVVVNVVGAVVAGAAQSTGMFIAGRVVVGVGVGLGQTAASTYVAETTAPGVRSLALGLYFSCWAVGALLAAGISYGCQSLEPSNYAWRIPSFLQAAMPLLITPLLFLVPESPRWLASQDRRDEALAVLARINGQPQDAEDVQLQFAEILTSLDEQRQQQQRNGKTGRSTTIAALRNMVRGPMNRKRLLLALSIAPLSMLTGSNVITYYFGTMLTQAGITSSTTQLQINVILSSWQLLVSVLGSLLADKLGRRFLALAGLAACTVFFYILAGLTAKFGTSHNEAGVYGTIACIFLFLGAYGFGITPLTAMYGPEVLPYGSRANGIAAQGMLIKACGLLVTLAFPQLFASIGWKTYVVNASWNVLIWGYVYWQWVETKGLTLEEVDGLFGGVVGGGDGDGEVGSIMGREAVEEGEGAMVRVEKGEKEA